MLKNPAGFALALLIGLSPCGCKKEVSAVQRTAQDDQQWRERQRQQAIKYYAELIKSYPDSPNVAEAKRKMDALGPAATPAKK
jgi:outer membrane protein assembly factor BamD (BamD/ComL family)